jgi:hypothetical protein
MGLFKSKSKTQVNKDNARQNDKKRVKYVWLSSHKAIFIITGEPRESKYSYGVPIIPLLGYYRSNGKSYTANELSGYYVVLNVDKNTSKEDLEKLKKGKVVIIGYSKDTLIIEEGEE